MESRFETFTGLITKIGRNVKKIKNREMAEYGLRSIHVSCLYYIGLADKITATELSERCEEDKATISRAVDYLEENGFVICESKSQKRYKSPIILTDSGREAAEKICEKVDLVLKRVSTVLTEEERVSFYKSLSVISDRLDECAKNII